MALNELTCPNRNQPLDFGRAEDLIFNPDIEVDVQDGLLILDRLEDSGLLTEEQKAGLKKRLERQVPFLLPVAKRAVWGKEEPPGERFWWL